MKEKNEKSLLVVPNDEREAVAQTVREADGDDGLFLIGLGFGIWLGITPDSNS